MNKIDDEFVIPLPEAARAHAVGIGLTKSIAQANGLDVQRRANGREFFSIPSFREFGRLVDKRTK